MNNSLKGWLPLEKAIMRFEHIRYFRLEASDHLIGNEREYCRLILIVTGEGNVETGDRGHLMGAGQWFMLLPGAFYVMNAKDGIGLAYYELTFRMLADSGAETGSDHMPDEEETRLFRWGEMSRLECLPILEKAKQLYLTRSGESSLEKFRLHLDFQELIYLLMNSTYRQREVRAEEMIWSVARYMEGQFQHTLTRDKLAGLAGMNPEYFSRIFKKVTGKTPKAYLMDIRMNHAKRELLRGAVAIGDIAGYVGFEEGYYFSRKFKQFVGMAPTEYASKQRHKVACTFFPYIDHMLTLGITPYSSMIPKSHPLAQRIASSIDLGEDESDFNERIAQKLFATEPEMVLCSNYLNPEQEAMLSRIAPAVPIVWNQNWRQALREIAVLLGRKNEAEEAITSYEQHCSEAAARLQNKLGKQTVALLRINKREIRLYGGPTQGYTGPVLYDDLELPAPELVRKLVWQGDMVRIRMEQLPELDADHLLLVIDPGAEEQAAKLMDQPEWQQLPAVNSGNVHRAGYFTWMSCGIEMNRLKIEEIIHFLGID